MEYPVIFSGQILSHSANLSLGIFGVSLKRRKVGLRRPKNDLSLPSYCSFSGLCRSAALLGGVFLQTLYTRVVKCILKGPHCECGRQESPEVLVLHCSFCQISFVQPWVFYLKEENRKGIKLFVVLL